MSNKTMNVYLNLIAKTAKRIDNNGWSEAGSGNISLILNSNDAEELIKNTSLQSKRIYKFNTKVNLKSLKDSVIVITNTGSRMREIAEHPKSLISFIKIEKDNFYKIIHGNNNITSEWETHLGLLNKFSLSKDKINSVIHIHSSEIIAFTHIKKDETEINKLLKSLVHELDIFLPEGIGFIKHYDTGSNNLVKETIKKLEKYKISLWEKHGIISSGEDLNTALDYIEIINQAIRVFFYLNFSSKF